MTGGELDTVIRPLSFLIPSMSACFPPPAPNVEATGGMSLFRYVETVWDLDRVCFAINVGDGKLECAFAFDF